MNGCCVDKSCTQETCMRLPEGRACGDCHHIGKCALMFGKKPEDTSCDFFPRSFVDKTHWFMEVSP